MDVFRSKLKSVRVLAFVSLRPDVYLLPPTRSAYAANIFNPKYGISSGKKPIQLPASPRHRPPTISVKILPSIPNAVHYRCSQPPFDGMSVHRRPVRSSLDRISIPLLARLYLQRQETSLEVPRNQQKRHSSTPYIRRRLRSVSRRERPIALYSTSVPVYNFTLSPVLP